ncbi:MAG: class F sortase [Anaerolineaceae bacterium]|nr:class F sortase [Anaerolineaceae bacterium]
MRKNQIALLLSCILLFCCAAARGEEGGIELNLVRIEIPRLNIDMEIEVVPFDEELKTWDITSSVGKFYWLEGTPHPEYGGNTVLAAHYMEYGDPGPLNRVRDFREGDEIYLYSDHMKYTYQVEKYQYIPDNYMKFMENRPYSLTLFTCAAFNWDTGHWEQRCVVLASLKEIDVIQ